MTTTKVRIEYKLTSEQLNKPILAHENDECYDLFTNGFDYDLKSFVPKTIGLGIQFNFDSHVSARIYSRSSTIFNYGLILPNGLGLIDSGYKGEVGFIAVPLNNIKVPKFSKIAQIEFLYNDGKQKIILANSKIELIDMTGKEFTNFKNDRGGGFGSTGK